MIEEKGGMGFKRGSMDSLRISLIECIFKEDQWCIYMVLVTIGILSIENRIVENLLQ